METEKTSTEQEEQEQPEQQEDQKPETENEPEKKYTDEEVNKLIDKKFAQWQKKKEDEVKEAEKLANMTAKEKAEHEMQKLKKELEGLRRANSVNEMTKVSREILSDRGISVGDELIETLIGKDADETKANINNFAESFELAVDEAVKEKLRGRTPKVTAGAKGLTKAEIMNERDMTKRRRLIAENTELFE